MEAASKGAKEYGGLVVGIVLQDSRIEANPWNSLSKVLGSFDSRYT